MSTTIEKKKITKTKTVKKPAVKKTKEEELNFENLPAEHPHNDKRTHGHWHPSFSVDVGENKGLLGQRLYFKGIAGGCGIMQVSGVVNLSEKSVLPENKERILKEIKDKGECTGCTSFIAILGQTFYASKEKYLLELGFRPLVKYNNAKHGDHYSQKLYHLDIDSRSVKRHKKDNDSY